MEGKRLLTWIRMKNLLSYASHGVEIELEPLNVLIGPNASGKSNLIAALSLLAAAPRELVKPIREGGGATEWLWKGEYAGRMQVAEVEVIVEYATEAEDQRSLAYSLAFSTSSGRFYLALEKLIDIGFPNQPPLYKGFPELPSSMESAFVRLRDPFNRPELTYVGDQFSQIRLFREPNFGHISSIRRPQQVDLPEDFLLEDASNLGLVLNDLENRPGVKKLLLEKLKLFYGRVENFTTKVQGGTIQVFFHEEGLNKPVPASRLSDGTLHYLCLLAILCHPEPPPLICIEEPELGLHPDILPEVGKLLIDASQRSQLVVTTHSDTLVSELSEVPEAVVVCERGDEGTTLRRLEPEKLKEWLERYRLGELWSMGEIGGNRW